MPLKPPPMPEFNVPVAEVPTGLMTAIWWEWFQRFLRWDEECCAEDDGGGGGAVSSVSGTPPVVVSGTALLLDEEPVAETMAAGNVTISMPAATGSVNGYLKATDWTTFNNKAPASHTHTASQVTDFAEATDDRVAALLTAGTNVTLTYNDAANTLSIAAAGGGTPLTDGDKGDIVVSGSGATWLFDSGVVTAVAKTVLDDTTTGAMLTTLGAAAASHTHTTAQVTGLDTALAGKEPTITGGTTAQYWRGDKSWQTLPAAGQPADATLTALAGLDATAGLVEQTGADAFTKRAMGVGATTSVLTRADGDARYVQGPASSVTARIATFNGTTGRLIQDSGTLLSGLQPIDGDLTAIAALATTGIVRRTATDTWSAGTAVTNAELATMGAYTFKANNTSGTAAVTDVTIAGLTTKASPTVSDWLMLSDSAASGAFKKAAWPAGSTTPATVAPLMDGVAEVGTTTKYAREDHVHPSDTARVAKTGDAITGDLSLDKASAGASRLLTFTTAGQPHWALNDFTDGTLYLTRYNPAGTYAAQAIQFAAGAATFEGAVYSGTVNITTPRPTLGAGLLGEWRTVIGAPNAALVLPAGGTWAWIGLVIQTSTGATNNNIYAGVHAGGTTIQGAFTNYTNVAACWRIL